MSVLKRVPIAALALSPLAASMALAQEQLEEIIVTARLRAEAFEETPAAITAFTAADIDSAGIQKPHDFIALTPNMTVVQTQNPGNSFITIRGVSQARNSDMPVAVVVDGVLMTNPAQFNQELFDIEQIEVLKGPQGALYGRNAIGGAVSIVTKAPTDDFEARVRAGADSGPGYLAQGTISGPLGDSDAWKYRASLSLADTDGFRDNEFTGDKADPYKDFSGRVRVTWEPSDTVTGDFRYARSDIETTALHFVINDDQRTLGSFVGVPNPNELSGVTVAPADVNNVNYTGVPILVNNPGEGLKEMDELSMKWDVAYRRRYVHVDHCVRRFERALDRRCIRFPADRAVVQRDLLPAISDSATAAADSEPFLRRLESSAVPRGQQREPGISVHVARDGSGALDRGRLLPSDRPVHRHG